MVRHSTLTAADIGSNPTSPANYKRREEIKHETNTLYDDRNRDKPLLGNEWFNEILLLHESDKAAH